MVKRKEELNTIINENMKGGPGKVKVTHITSSDELHNKTKMYAQLHMDKGSGLGYHEHHGEMEVIYVIKGVAEYNDNNQLTTVTEGDVCVCPDGQGHSIKAIEDLDLIANIIYL